MIPRCSKEVQDNWFNSLTLNSTGYSNPNWNGLTDEDLIEIGIKFIKIYKFIPGIMVLREFAITHLNLTFPKHFSKNRFGGKYINYSKILEEKTGLSYNPYYRHRRIILTELEKNAKN